MVEQQIAFAGQQLALLPCGAIYWPAERAVLVADMHLEKGSYFASHGQMLPPYDSVKTLADISKVLDACDVNQVFCLGDSFHDVRAFERLHVDTLATLQQLTRRVAWTWITGNHDPQVSAHIGGMCAPEIMLAGVLLRHEADAGDSRPEISGHYHPKLRLRVRGRMISRRCFAVSPQKIIMPAYGAFTGGLDVTDDAITLVAGRPLTAIIASDTGLHHFPVNPPT